MNINPNISCAVPDGYRPAHLYPLVEGSGCGGPSTVGWVLTPPGVTVGDVERVWRSAIKAASSVPSPALPPRLPFDSWEGTVGEHREASAQRDAERDAISGEHQRARENARRAVWDSAGYQLVEFATTPDVQGLEWDDVEEPVDAVPVAVVWERGCRCAHGGTYPADWNDDGDVCGPLVAVSDDAGVGSPHVVLWDDGFYVDVAAAAAAMDEARSSRLAAITERNERLVWAASLTSEDLDAMTVPEYKQYKELLAGSWVANAPRPVASPLDDTAAVAAAHTAAASVAASHGVYLFTLNARGVS